MVNVQMNTGNYVVGIDLGGTKIEMVVFDQYMKEVLKTRIKTPGNYASLLDAIVDLVNCAETRLEVDLDSIGIGMPGFACVHTGLWRNTNLVYCEGRNVQLDLDAALHRKILIENDANCFALSEAIDGSAKNCRMVLALTIGTGIGGAIIVDRVLHIGPNRLAGELGHMPLPWLQENDHPLPKCYCGRAACVEQYLSGAGFERDYCSFSDVLKNGAEIIQLKQSGDAIAIQAYSRLVDRFARFLAGIYSSIDPDCIVLGGGMSEIEGLIDDIQQQLPQYLSSPNDIIPLVKAAFGGYSGVRGAALLHATL